MMTENAIDRVSFRVPDMMCDHCKMAITKALGCTGGVRKTSVDLGGKVVTVEFERGRVTASELKKAIAEAGYTPEAI
ncbi:MAG: heavy-metal-associated domain-containing protein [Ignavibacteriales bacterium]